VRQPALLPTAIPWSERDVPSVSEQKVQLNRTQI